MPTQLTLALNLERAPGGGGHRPHPDDRRRHELLELASRPGGLGAWCRWLDWPWIEPLVIELVERGLMWPEVRGLAVVYRLTARGCEAWREGVFLR